MKGVSYLEGAEQALINAHHGSSIVELATVIGCAEQGDKLSFGEKLVAVLNDLMRSADEIHVVFLQEARDDVRAEGEGHTSIVFAPSGDVLIGIRPQ